MGFVKAALGLQQKATSAAFDTTVHEEWLRRNGYLDAFAGNFDDYTARTVSVSGSLEVSAVLACAKILGEDTGSLPFNFYRRNPRDGQVEQARDDWRWSVLHGMANDEMASGEFVEALTSTAALTGDALADIEYFDRGRQAMLWPRDSRYVTIVREGARDGKPRRTFYEVRGEARKTRREMFHLRGFTFNGARGDNILRRARRVLGLALTAQEFAGRHFSQGVHSDLFLEHPAGSSEIVANIEEAYKRKQGASKAGVPFVLSEGMRARRVPPDLRRQQLLEARIFQLLEVCRLFRIQPHKLSHLDRATFNNIEELQIDHATNTLGPWRRRWTEAVRRHLLTDDERRRDLVYAEHNVEALLRGNFEQQTEGWSKLILAGVYSINEVRAWLNMNPVEGGDAHRVQMQMQDIRRVASEVVKMLQAA